MNSMTKQFYRFTLTVAMAMITWMGTALSQSTTPTTTPSVPAPIPGQQARGREALGDFDHFLDNHPGVAQQLKSNPSLINDPTFLSQHPQLQQFLSKNPGIQKAAQSNPSQLLNRERRFERNGGDITRNEAAKGDRFLDSHPEIAQQLRKDPSLIDNKQFVESHPQLEQFLKTHPEVRKDWKEHPKAFMKRERQFDRREAQRRHRHQ